MSQVALQPRTFGMRRMLRRGKSTLNPTALITNLMLGAVPALVLAVLVAREIVPRQVAIPFTFLLFGGVVAITIRDIRIGVAMFILATGLSPKLPGVYKNLRVEDFVFIAVFAQWAMNYRPSFALGRLRAEFVLPGITLLVLGLVSLPWGYILQTIPDMLYAGFMVVKRLEYFLVFWVVATTIKDEDWLRALSLLFVFSGASAAMYGILNPGSGALHIEAESRVVGPEGENYNTLSGYLVMCVGVGIGLLPQFRKGHQRLFLLGSLGVCAAGVLFSFSREGLIMLAGAVVVFGFTRHRGLLVLAVIGLLLAFGTSEDIRANLANTFNQIQTAGGDDPGSNSLTARYYAWNYRWNLFFMKQPIVGTGVGSIALSVDNEYLLRACETGTLGFLVFVWWLGTVGKFIRRMVRLPGLTGCLGTGLFSGFVGLLIQGGVATSFTAIRTMEAFWYLLGLCTAAVGIYKAQLAAKRQADEAAALVAAGGPIARRIPVSARDW